MWQRGLLILIDFEGWIHRDCLILWSSDVFFLGDTSESDVLGTSRCIWNTWFYAHTSEMPDLEPSRCTEALVSVGDTSGLRFQCPSRCTKVQYQVNNTSGWADIDYFRCISFFRHYLIHRDSIIHGHSDVSHFKVHRDSQF